MRLSDGSLCEQTGGLLGVPYMKGKAKVIISGVLFLSFLVIRAEAGRVPESWDTLPQIQNIAFSENVIGFDAADGRHFVLDRKNESFREVNSEAFFKEFPVPKDQTPSEVLNNTGIGSTVLLRTSSRVEFQTQNAYCSEGENTHHSLSRNGKVLRDHVAPCHSISAVEVVGDQLWLGTRYDGEYGEYPAAGVVIQSLISAKLLKGTSNNRVLKPIASFSGT